MDLLNNGLGTDCVIRFPNPDHIFYFTVVKELPVAEQ